jgi:hypothetical protein
MIPDRLLSSQNKLSEEGVYISSCRLRESETKAHLAILEVVKQYMKSLALNTVLLDDNASASNDLARIPLSINLAKSCPCSEDLGVPDLDQVNFVFGTQGLDELNVLCFRAGLHEDAQMRLALVQGFGTLAKTTGKAVMNERILQDLLITCHSVFSSVFKSLWDIST